LEFTKIVPVSEIVQNELLLTKRGHFRRGGGAWQGGTPAALFLRREVRQEDVTRGCPGSLTISQPEEPGDFLKKNDRNLSEKYFLKKVRAAQQFSTKKPARTFPAKKK